ncbi:MAG: radical SAM protein [Magnetococcales bacterium]|nr:radical SAM protein [Magnetococcales bacterium]
MNLPAPPSQPHPPLRILLISPFMSYRDRWGQYHEGAGDTFPAGIGAIAGYLESFGHPVALLEPDVVGMDRNDFIAFLRQGDYQLIGISVFTTNVVFAYETARLIREILPDTRILMGGSHPTIFPERTLSESPETDFIIAHEGEKPTLALVRALIAGTDLAEVPNLWYRDGDVIRASLHKGGWLNLDELPIFPYHKFDMSRYTPAPSLRRVLPTFNYMAQRGCPFLCSFCDTSTHGHKVRYRSVEKVLDDLQTLKEQFGIRGVIFEGSNFTINPNFIRRLCQGMLDRKLDLTWYCMGRADLDHDLLPLMKQAGMWAMSFGLESCNPETLQRMQKRLNVQQVKATMQVLSRLRVRTIGSFILGYPGETEKDILNTIEFAVELDLDVAVFFIPVPFPGTKLLRDVQELGGLKPDLQWQDYSAWLDHNHPIYINPLIGTRQVELYNYAFRRFYTRPGYIWKQLRQIRSANDVMRLLQGFKSVRTLIMKGFQALLPKRLMSN